MLGNTTEKQAGTANLSSPEKLSAERHCMSRSHKVLGLADSVGSIET